MSNLSKWIVVYLTGLPDIQVLQPPLLKLLIHTRRPVGVSYRITRHPGTPVSLRDFIIETNPCLGSLNHSWNGFSWRPVWIEHNHPRKKTTFKKCLQSTFRIHVWLLGYPVLQSSFVILFILCYIQNILYSSFFYIFLYIVAFHTLRTTSSFSWWSSSERDKWISSWQWDEYKNPTLPWPLQIAECASYVQVKVQKTNFTWK